ncbi:hypothetical protein Back11_29990 [Paenibacillus baekrokdamisoli]|uniref:Uncharacterized protein n=1 Tax=Paenibacillus baekrokdamisoli TaxID=1712516 RepID=A0A3G9JEN9_9BACL|nr:hypothetical protein [Paenibacillus baekrokdamisoli]MBB3071237.1 uncharacterized protein YbaR (Trm112 family) [Paenibacillus baekrokdamisoli]BBH21654.1 hypothetical protein Back11_29990 [Paenibacillus baekrokdamisoli]
MLCPICNGLEQLAAKCPSCLKLTNDYGQIADFTAPYAPYQQDSDTSYSMETMISNLDGERSCKHVLYCPNCEKTYEATVMKWH